MAHQSEKRTDMRSKYTVLITLLKQTPQSFISYQHLSSDVHSLIYAEDVLRQMLHLPVAYELLVRVVF